MGQDDIHNDILRKMTPEQKLEASMSLYHSARNLKAAWFRHLHSDWSEEQVEQAVRDVFAKASAEG